MSEGINFAYQTTTPQEYPPVTPASIRSAKVQFLEWRIAVAGCGFQKGTSGKTD
jgi:hypothetical protein